MAQFSLVVADSSALIALATCDALELLESVTSEVVAPEAVFREVIVQDKSQSAILRRFLEHRVESVALERLIVETGSLGRGELEAMALFRIRDADVLLMDDNRARKVAHLNEIPVVGSLGILALAKQSGLIDSISPFIETLRSSDLFFSDALLRRVLQLVDEC